MLDDYGAGGGWLLDSVLWAGIVNTSVGFRAQGEDDSAEISCGRREMGGEFSVFSVRRDAIALKGDRAEARRRRGNFCRVGMPVIRAAPSRSDG